MQRIRPPTLTTVEAFPQPIRSAHQHPMRLTLKMQLPNPPPEDLFPSIESALQGERVARYMPAAQKDKAVAFKFYLWNCTLCEAFVLPLHFSEILCRNALHAAIIARGDEKWFQNPTFIGILDDRFKVELRNAVDGETYQHGNSLSAHHIVSALTFGFWEHLTTKRFERYLWARGIRHAFPGAPKGSTYEDLQTLIESVRRWRNRIAHHRAIFDKRPMRKHQDTLKLIEWVCGDTAAWVSSASRVPAALSLRPA